jgi:hypothetical protein
MARRLGATKHTFIAWLSYQRGAAYVLAARLEYHGHEPGLHCHASCGDLDELPAGVVKPFGTRRVPQYGTFHRRVTYEMTESSALSLSFEFFGVNAPPEGAMI